MTGGSRLIEVAFPLKQASIDSVHEKNVRHGHISTLHIWPARRPLAASRAALLAALLPDPGTPETRRALCERIGGRVVRSPRTKKLPNGRSEQRLVEETVGGILHWGRETKHRDEVDRLREEIRKAFGGRAPRMLDPFAGGGAIPLEAMRLGCDVTAVDINPVAWLILRSTLEYPQKLSGRKYRLPDFVLRDAEFMAASFKSQGFTRPQVRTFLSELRLAGENEAPPLDGFGDPVVQPAFLEADLAWHVRAWGRWVLAEARRELARLYPVYADFEPLLDDGTPWERRPRRLVPCRSDGTADVDSLNQEFDGRPSSRIAGRPWLDDPRCPRWVAKPIVAYLWARTVKCKNCRATIPLLKTRWLVRKDSKRAVLVMEPNADRTGVVFDVLVDPPLVGGNNAARREHDRKLGLGTMSRAGAWCPSCGKPGTVAMEMEDIRAEGLAGRLGVQMTAVVVDGPNGKAYRLPTELEDQLARPGDEALKHVFSAVPLGLPNEPMPGKEALGIRLPLYGYDKWSELFTARQLVALGTFARVTRSVTAELERLGYGPEWREAILGYLALMLDRLANQSSSVAHWNSRGEKIEGTFARFALPIVWDFAEVQPLAETSGGYPGAVEWVSLVVGHTLAATSAAPAPRVLCRSAIGLAEHAPFDVIVTDPPYYDAIPYSDLMDFFYVWVRRVLGDHGGYAAVFGARELAPKWDGESGDGELIDDSSRHGGDAAKSKQVYEDGMARAFHACGQVLAPDGRLVIVFANKQPDAWETLVAAIIKAGFVVDGSWPIQTERAARMRSLASAALASSVWLVCRKRLATARPGWDNTVLADMRTNIARQLREFWDAGIRGPDFVWAATGPALEAYSKHPIVKKADMHGELMTVTAFLKEVRRIVVDFVVGRVLSEAAPAGGAATEIEGGLDDVTTYYLLHRYDFGLADAPAGACILYAVSCNLSEADLADRYDVLVRTGGTESHTDDDDEETEEREEPEEGSGSTFRLKPWKQRTRPGMGFDAGKGFVPLIDQAHRLMHLWKAGDQGKVDQYLEDRGLRRSQVFHQLLQALVELAPEGSDERSVLESVMNHLRAVGVWTSQPRAFDFAAADEAGSTSDGAR